MFLKSRLPPKLKLAPLNGAPEGGVCRAPEGREAECFQGRLSICLGRTSVSLPVGAPLSPAHRPQKGGCGEAPQLLRGGK